MSTDVEARLRAALTARADLVRPEDLASYATVTPLRPRWQSPWVLLATAAVVLLVLGVVLQGVGGASAPTGSRRSPTPTPRRSSCRPTSGATGSPTTSRLPLASTSTATGSRRRSTSSASRPRSSTGAPGCRPPSAAPARRRTAIAELGTTIGTSPLEPIDADDDGDQELVLLRDESFSGPVVGNYPLVFDLRDGLLVQAVVEDPDLLVRGEVPVAGSETEFYDLARVHAWSIEDGTLRSSRSVDAYARGQMMLFTPRSYVADEWEWTLDDDGVLRHGEPTCVMQSFDSARECGLDPVDTLMYVPVERAAYVEPGGTLDTTDEAGYGFTARIDGAGTPRRRRVRPAPRAGARRP